MSKLRFIPVIILTVALVSCVVIFERGSVDSIDPAPGRPIHVETPVKAHLLDGGVVVFADGATVSDSEITGQGLRFGLLRRPGELVRQVPLDSVIGIEAFTGEVDYPSTAVATVLGSAVAVVGASALAVAIFGSCPTFYASAEQGGALQAEAFSYSIAENLETEDVDRLFLQPDADGVVRLELRNEALETHYINRLELVMVEHAPGVQVVPDEKGRLLGASEPIRPLKAVDRGGRRVLDDVIAKDQRAFSSTEARIMAATSEDPEDYLELTFPRPDSDQAVLLVSLRNSLLNTVLFYDMMLGSVGAQALNWWGGRTENIGVAFELARWYLETSGLKVQVPDQTVWRTVARVPDVGPIAWEELGLRIPVPEAGPVRVRLSSLADDWRIDRVALTKPVETFTSRRLPVERMSRSEDRMGVEVVERLSESDDEYLVTYPGTSMTLEFEPMEPSPGNELSFLLAAEGYYVEWVRPEWIRMANRLEPFQPGSGSVERLLASWLEKRPTFEDAFFNSKIPVR
jgi:hypothetical protein